MKTTFERLNGDWNADPNSPLPRVAVEGQDVSVSFYLNAYLYPQFQEGQCARLRFSDCWRYRLGPTNDEGWYRGQCRFSGVAPQWGEFYEASGDLKLDHPSLQWQGGPASAGLPSKHFLFYFRDETFECDARDWRLEVLGVDPAW
jgi:hypothetical protein